MTRNYFFNLLQHAIMNVLLLELTDVSEKY